MNPTLAIISETGIASGVRRIEAVTGATALQWVADNELRLQRIADMVKGLEFSWTLDA